MTTNPQEEIGIARGGSPRPITQKASVGLSENQKPAGYRRDKAPSQADRIQEVRMIFEPRRT